MRIIIAAHGLRRGGGISVGQNVIAALGRLAPHHKYYVTAPSGLGYEKICKALPMHELSLFKHGGDQVRRYFYETHELPTLIRQFGADAALCLGNVALKGINIPQTLLLHNPYYVYPTSHYGRAATRRLRLKVAAQRLQFARDLRRIRLLLCQTDVMASRVRETYGYQGPIKICPNAVSRYTLAGAENDLQVLPKPLERFASKRRLFCLTAYYSHKNLEAVVDLFHNNRDALRDFVAVLTIDKSQGAGAKRLLDTIIRLDLEDSIVNIGPLPQQALSAYFNNCHALLMPSLLESFSGTYLEAMHYGLPIITSDMSFAKEICGDAAKYFNPWDLDAMLEAVLTVDKYSDELVALGKERLGGMFYGWDDVGAEFLDAVEGIAR